MAMMRKVGVLLALALVLPMLGGGADGKSSTRKSRAAPEPPPSGDSARPGAGGTGTGSAGGAAGDVMEAYDQFCGAALVEKGLGNADQAIQLLGATIAQVPNVSVGWLELGAIFGAIGDTQLARRCLRSAARLDSHDEQALGLMRQLSARGGLPPIAAAIELDSPTDAAAEHQNRYKRRLYERYYMLDCRLRRLRQALNLRPDSVGALVAAAEVSGELLYHRQAVDMLQRALELDSGNGAIFVKLVEAQVKGCVFSKWDDNFKKLEDFILAQAAAGLPVVLGPIQSTMYPLPPNVGLAICRQAGEQAQAAVVRSGHTPFSHPSALSPLPGDTAPEGITGVLGSFFGGGGGGGGAAGAAERGGRLVVGYVTSHFTSSSIGREMLFLLGAHAAHAVAAHCYALNADEGSWLQVMRTPQYARGNLKPLKLSTLNPQP